MKDHPKGRLKGHLKNLSTNFHPTGPGENAHRKAATLFRGVA